MQCEMLFSKIHRATLSEANINYVGSITIDSALCEEAGLLEGMKVDVVNVNNGERLSTYVIKGEAHSGTICLNGAAARKASIGDIIIIISYVSMDYERAKSHKPKVVFVDSKNHITKVESHIDSYPNE
ncbi:aspartate 1-decarboxylase [Helicobacter sp. T3_23-1059]